MRLKKNWTKPVIRRLEDSSSLSPRQKAAVRRLREEKARKVGILDD